MINQDAYFDSILDKYRGIALKDKDIVSLVELMYENIDISPPELPEETFQEFKKVILRLIPGRAADIFFDMINDSRLGIPVTQEWTTKLSPLELNLFVTVLLHVLVLFYEKDIPDEYKVTIKNGIMVNSMFAKPDSCSIL